MRNKNNRKWYLFIIAIIALSAIAYIYINFQNNVEKDLEKKGKSNTVNKDLTIAFYNVENLFDTYDDPNKDDNEFLPTSEKKWNEERYQKKISDISKVIQSIDKDMPDVIGLAEVENRNVLLDLINSEDFKKYNFDIIHFESPDHRGIDCALLFKKDKIEILDKKPIKYLNPLDPSYLSRDILYVKGQLTNQEVVHFYVNHWPSRRGGVAKTENRRLAASKILKTNIDSIFNYDPSANMIIMGDMNDTPINKSLYETLDAKENSNKSSGLINLMYVIQEKNKGSYNFKGNWQVLDNLIVSKTLLDNMGYKVYNNTGYVHFKDWMTYTNKSGELVPNRTYGGPNYYGGYSDHFPVYLTLKLE